MGILTISGIVLGAIGSAAMGVGGVFLAIDASQKGTKKFLETWKTEVTKEIEKLDKK